MKHSYQLRQAIWRIQICAILSTDGVRQAPAVRAGKGIGTPGKGKIDSNRGLHVLEAYLRPPGWGRPVDGAQEEGSAKVGTDAQEQRRRAHLGPSNYYPKYESKYFRFKSKPKYVKIL